MQMQIFHHFLFLATFLTGVFAAGGMETPSLIPSAYAPITILNRQLLDAFSLHRDASIRRKNLDNTICDSDIYGNSTLDKVYSIAVTTVVCTDRPWTIILAKQWLIWWDSSHEVNLFDFRRIQDRFLAYADGRRNGEIEYDANIQHFEQLMVDYFETLQGYMPVTESDEEKSKPEVASDSWSKPEVSSDLSPDAEVVSDFELDAEVVSDLSPDALNSSRLKF